MNDTLAPAIALPQPLLSPGARATWRVVQFAVWAIGVAIVVALLFEPALGIDAFWNVLIPVAPALVAVAPGLWRNICPLGSTALFSHHMGFSRARPIGPLWQARLGLIGVIALFAIVPLRHVVLDLSGLATAVTLLSLAAVAVVMGVAVQCKSGWCSGLCPVHPVEKLYGSESVMSVPNAHCEPCVQCVALCPDSTPGMHSLTDETTLARRFAGTLMAGGFAGFIWGWFQVRDYVGAEGWRHLGEAYAWPLAGTVATLAAFLVLRQAMPKKHETTLIRVFAAAAIACYYWYRLPALFGFGPFPGDGMLVDLTGSLPSWFPIASQIVTTLACLWWLVARRQGKTAWGVRPPYASDRMRAAPASSA